MKHCFVCGQEMSINATAKGLAKYDMLVGKALEEGWEFEGWVNVIRILGRV